MNSIRTGGAPRARPRPRLSVGATVWVYNAVLVACAVALYSQVVTSLPVTVTPPPWWVFAVACVVADVLVVHLRFGREAYTLTLSEIPLAIGLAFAGPAGLLAARLVGGVLGGVIGLGFRGSRSATKFVFNLALIVIETCLALWLFEILTRGLPPGIVPWRQVYVAVVVSQLFAQVAVLVILRLHRLPWNLKSQVVLPCAGNVLNATVGAIAVLLIDADALAGALMLLISTFVSVLAYRSYNRLREQHESLALLQDLTHAVGNNLDQAETTRTLLAETRKLLRAEVAEIVLLSDEARAKHLRLGGTGDIVESVVDLDPVIGRLVTAGQPLLATRRERRAGVRSMLSGRGLIDAVIAPLQTPSGSGAVIVGNRMGETTTFSQHDLRLLQTVADHARVLLENGRLVHQLRQEIADKEHQATHDALTGLANRFHFSSLIADAIATAERSNASVGVMLLDLDRFKDVNDTLGHHVGDLLLTEVAERLRKVLRDADGIARLGGDEFCVLLTGQEADRCGATAERVRAALEQPFQLAGLNLFVGASVGIAVFPDHADGPDALLQRADVAMYAAKEAHAGCVVYNEELDQHSHRSLALAAELRAALEARALQVHYQPKADLQTGRTVGVEALVRWIHAERGFIPPDEFIPLAEHTGLINPLTDQVFDQVFDQLVIWYRAGRVWNAAVNVSAGTILSTGFVEGLRARFVRAGLPPSAITLEITESQVMADPVRAAAVLQALRDLGVRISIDDFGTGYSSLSQLKRLPVDELKIDRSFVFGMCSDPDDAVIVRSTVELAHNLGLEVVAEGVEDSPTWDELAQLGCDLAQGYYLSRPLPPDALEEWFAQQCEVVPAG